MASMRIDAIFFNIEIRYMKKFIVAIVLLSGLTIFAQKEPFKIEYDYARFALDDSSGYLELYYSFYEPDFEVTGKNSDKEIKGSLSVLIKNASTEEILVNKEYQFTSGLHDSNGVEGKSLIGNLGFQLPFGKYNFTLIGRDVTVSGRADTIYFPLDMNITTKERFTLSDIQLASSIYSSEKTNSVFYKNSYEVVPNPSMIFGGSYPLIYFYTEIYNLTKSVQSELLMVEHNLYNSKNNLVYKKRKFVSRKNNNIVEAGGINISKMPTDAYTLNIQVTDTLMKYSAITSKKVYVINPNIIDTTATLTSEGEMLSSEFLSMGEEELNEAFEMARYVATGKETDQWGKFKDADGKRQFLYNFWKGRNLIPGVSQVSASKEYYEKARYANEKFGNIHRKGWKTDRGRVYMLYGEPSEIDRFPNQVDVKPYEIWYYNSIEGGVQFIFADLTGFSDYMLIHSTMRGELRDDNWQRRIRTN